MLLYVTTHQKIILIVNSIIALIFSSILFSRGSYEFVTYVGMIVLVGAVIVKTNKQLQYTNTVLWGLTLWALLHFAGGTVLVNGQKLYTHILVPIHTDIFRYDQLVHIIGFGVATLLMYEVLRVLLKRPITHWGALGMVVVMAGLGVGALNEIIEFGITLIVPETNVGGYINTSLDLVADLAGAILAYFVIVLHREKNIHNAKK